MLGQAFGQALDARGAIKGESQKLRGLLKGYAETPEEKEQIDSLGLAELREQAGAIASEMQAMRDEREKYMFDRMKEQDEASANLMASYGENIAQQTAMRDAAANEQLFPAELKGLMGEADALRGKIKGMEENFGKDYQDAGLGEKAMTDLAREEERAIRQAQLDLAGMDEQIARTEINTAEGRKRYDEIMSRPLDYGAALNDALVANPKADPNLALSLLQGAGTQQQNAFLAKLFPEKFKQAALGTRALATDVKTAEDTQGNTVALSDAVVKKAEGEVDLIPITKRLREAQIANTEQNTEVSKAELDKVRAEIKNMPAAQKAKLYTDETNRILAEAQRKTAELKERELNLKEAGRVDPSKALLGYGQVLDQVREQIRDLEYHEQILRGDPKAAAELKRTQDQLKDARARADRLGREMQKFLPSGQGPNTNSIQDLPANYQTPEAKAAGVAPGALVEINGIKYRVLEGNKMQIEQ
jgi:hypothetical protein